MTINRYEILNSLVMWLVEGAPFEDLINELSFIIGLVNYFHFDMHSHIIV